MFISSSAIKIGFFHWQLVENLSLKARTVIIKATGHDSVRGWRDTPRASLVSSILFNWCVRQTGWESFNWGCWEQKHNRARYLFPSPEATLHGVNWKLVDVWSVALYSWSELFRTGTNTGINMENFSVHYIFTRTLIKNGERNIPSLHLILNPPAINDCVTQTKLN